MRRTFPFRVAALLVAWLVALAGPGSALAHGLTHAHLARAHPTHAHEAHHDDGPHAPAVGMTVAPADHDHAHGHASVEVAPVGREAGDHVAQAPAVVVTVAAPVAALGVRVVRPPAVTHPAALPRPDPATGPPGDSRAPPID